MPRFGWIAMAGFICVFAGLVGGCGDAGRRAEGSDLNEDGSIPDAAHSGDAADLADGAELTDGDAPRECRPQDPDGDGDMIADACDNCPTLVNIDQRDTRGYGAAPIPFAPVNTEGASVISQLEGQDDKVAGPLRIGFDFHYFGQTFDTFWVSTNGMIGFVADGESLTTVYRPKPLPETNANTISASWSDWEHVSAGGTMPASEISYQFIGEAPNRALVVTWKNLQHVYDEITRGTFQVILRETDENTGLHNTIEVHTTSQPRVTLDPDAEPEDGAFIRGVVNGDNTIGLALQGENRTRFSTMNTAVRFTTQAEPDGAVGDLCDGFIGAAAP